MKTLEIDRLDNILGDAQFANRGLETDDVNDAIMESLGYSEARRAAVYAVEEPVFETLIDSHGFAIVRIELEAAITKLTAAKAA